MDRRKFFQNALSAASMISISGLTTIAESCTSNPTSTKSLKSPLAITMWDFSWLERRWPGAGFEDWDKALDELAERGYNAVRIDAYPHLLAADSKKEWQLLPEWSVQNWGAPARCVVQIQPFLNQFIRKCKERHIKVALSTWFREDIDNERLKLTTPELHISIWKETLESIDNEGLLDNILYVDFTNEFPFWGQFLPMGFKRDSKEGADWMRKIEEGFRIYYPDMPLTFSSASGFNFWKEEDVSMHDFLELHLWMSNYSEFYKEIDYNYERFDTKPYERVQLYAEKLYRSKPGYWQNKLKEGIQLLINWSKLSNKPLVTTECWGIVDYKDFPMLNWEWVKELCELGTIQAASSGRWLAIATSNFCAPQFVGMWRDKEWHRKLTAIIKNAPIDKSLYDNKLINRI